MSNLKIEIGKNTKTGESEELRLVAEGGLCTNGKDEVLARLGDPFATEFNACTSVLEMIQVAEKYFDQMTEDEKKKMAEYLQVLYFVTT